MSRIRGKDTVPERIVRALLRSKGYRYRKNASELPGKPDIVLSSLRVVIFVHGCFWHRHNHCRFATNPKSNVDFWERKFLRTVARDRDNIKALRKLGWKVIVIWECSLQGSASSARRKILSLDTIRKK
jgi:DNA mismatch endonuclease (patch repair protein)